MMRCSRPMSWAVARTCLSGGRRSTYWRPSASAIRYVMFDLPPATSVNVTGARRPSTFASSHGTSVASLIPSGAVVMWGVNLSVASLRSMADVTDQTFEQDVMERSKTVPVVVDLWAEWCGPCKTLGPILEKVIDETGGEVVLAKVDVDANPSISRAFQVQSTPAVYALKDGKIVDGFVGAQPEAAVREFVGKLTATKEPTEVERLIELGDEDSLRRALELEPDNEDAIVTLAEHLVVEEQTEEAL